MHVPRSAVRRCPLRSCADGASTGSPLTTVRPVAGRPRQGTDRRVRGLLLAALRAADGPLPAAALAAAAPDQALRDPAQRDRALDGLVADGLVEPLEGQLYRLPA